MSKITLSNLANLNNATTVTAVVNSNNQTLTDAVDNTLSRDGTSPNTMNSVIDMNSNRVINLGAPTGSLDAVRLLDLRNSNALAADLATAIGQAQVAAASATTSAAGAVVSASSASSSAASASTSATAASSSATSAATSASSAAASLLSIQTGGIWNNTNKRAISTTYSVINSDKGKTIEASGGGYVITFNAAAGYDADFICFVQNTSSTRAKRIAINGLSNSWNSNGVIFLWPLCGGFVFQSSGIWYHTFPQRWPLTQQGTTIQFHVDPVNGNDANDGLATGTGNALFTIQEGVDRIHCLMDHGNFVPSVALADGTHNVGAGVFINYPIGHTEFLIQGNPATPTNCIISCDAGGSCFFIQEPTTITLDGMYLTTTGNGATAISSRQFATCDLINITYGNFPLGVHLSITNHSSMNILGSQVIAGSAVIHLAASDHSFYSNTTFGETINGGLTFTDYITVTNNSIVRLGSVYGGAGAGSGTTCQKYTVATNGIIESGGTTIPGNSAGSVFTQGQFF